MRIQAAVTSLRLRTLPLSLSGILTGIFLAAADQTVSTPCIVFLILTACSLQILSNLSNELGDTLHHTDTDDRQGIRYSLQNGAMTIKQMKRLILCFVLLSCLFGILMIHASFDTFLSPEPIAFLLLGIAAIWSAIHYTLGEHPYGYRGWGDLFVFLFFGLATVIGSYYICAHHIPSWTLLLPAATIGCFSVGVLNTNNIRDIQTDAATRRTTAIRLGTHRAKIYQTLLIMSGWFSMAAYGLLHRFPLQGYLFVLTLPLFILQLRGIHTRTGKALDPMLPLLVISTFLFSLLLGAGLFL